MLAKDQDGAVEMCKRLVKEERVHYILVCLGFTHREVAEIAEAVRENVAIAVAKRDGPSNTVSMEVRKWVKLSVLPAVSAKRE